ncbi:hypothetical protein B7494_g1663 [Chlorociboria aeruginascens]|nr:hypothetical protein B7494_g1663 [Chlorociboria aeruginascens]
MDHIIDSRFERVEKSLATLINSISTYNPNPALAHDLVTADQELSKGLSQLSTHQQNHARILSLRSTSSTLDAQIRETLILLTTTRKSLLATPSAPLPETTKKISYEELLSYAGRISRFTIPQGYRVVEKDEGNGNETEGEKPEPQTNGSTPTAGLNGAEANGDGNPNTAMEIDSSTPISAHPSNPNPFSQTQTQTAAQRETRNPNSTALPADIAEFMKEYASQNQFIPWPTEAVIRRGALATIQLMLDKGIDPATVGDGESGEVGVEQRMIVEEEGKTAEEDRRRREEENRVAEEVERKKREGLSLAAGGVAPADGDVGGNTAERERKQFVLETFDDEDDD